MKTILKTLILLGFLGICLNLPPFFQPMSGLPQAFSQEGTTSSVGTPPSNPSGETKTAPWYKDPTRTAFAGAFATCFAAFIAALINLSVRKLTNKHELKKLSLEKQLSVYGQFFDKIVEIDSFGQKRPPEEFMDKLMQLMAEFERSYPFLDKQTIKVFDERISQPFNTGELVNMLHSKGYEMFYKEIRHRLLGEVLQTAKNFLDQFK